MKIVLVFLFDDSIEGHAEHGGTLNEHQLNRLVLFQLFFGATVIELLEEGLRTQMEISNEIEQWGNLFWNHK